MASAGGGAGASVVTVQLGQCGNQIGAALFGLLHDDLAASAAASRRRRGPRGGDSVDGSDASDAVVTSPFFREATGHTGDGSPPIGRALPVARAVLIDMEPKVVSARVAAARKGGQWRYSPSAVFSKQSGSANNWAYGYNKHGPACRSQLRNLIRKEVEHCDHLSGFLLLHSVAGGTGSGVGTYVTQLLRDDFGAKATLANAVVWPHNAGEVIVQNYNSLLTVSHLAQHSDGMIVFENDAAAATCRQLMRLKSPSFDDLNGVIAGQLAMALLPSLSSPTSPEDVCTTGVLRETFGSVMRHCLAHPGYPLLTMRVIPQMPPDAIKFSSHTWPGLMKHLHQMQIANAKMEEGINWHVTLPEMSRPTLNFGSSAVRTRDTPAAVRSGAGHGAGAGAGAGVASTGTSFTEAGALGLGEFNRTLAGALLLRGDGLDRVDMDSFRDPRMYARWNPEPLLVACHPQSFRGYGKTAAYVRCAERANKMFGSAAYVHQYTSHGLSEDSFDQSFATVEQLLHNYRHLR